MRNPKLIIVAAWLVLVGCTSTISQAEGGTETTVDVSGVWEGVNYTSKVPGPHQVRLKLTQTGSDVEGTYCVTTGVCGKGSGSVSGDTMTMRWTNTTPSCPGAYTNKYRVTDDQMIWIFEGEDCLGEEHGHGYAKKQ